MSTNDLKRILLPKGENTILYVEYKPGWNGKGRHNICLSIYVEAKILLKVEIQPIISCFQPFTTLGGEVASTGDKPGFRLRGSGLDNVINL